MTIDEMIKEYSIEPITYGPNEGKLIIRRPPDDRSELIEQIPEIKKYFSDKQAKKAAENARRAANVAAIPGLKEIINQQKALAKWNYEFEKSFEGECACGGLGVGPKPQGNEKALLEQYPQAAAYLRIKHESESANYELNAIGSKALNEIEDDPSRWESVIENMNKEIKEFIDRHIWD